MILNAESTQPLITCANLDIATTTLTQVVGTFRSQEVGFRFHQTWTWSALAASRDRRTNWAPLVVLIANFEIPFILGFLPQLPRQEKVACFRPVRSLNNSSQNRNSENSLNETVLGTGPSVQPADRKVHRCGCRQLASSKLLSCGGDTPPPETEAPKLRRLHRPTRLGRSCR